MPRPTVPAEPTPGRRACSPAADPGGLMALKEIIHLVFLDIAIVVVAARLIGRLFRRLRQPAVVGEIVAGVVLGPSLLGLLPGDLDRLLFPTDVRPYLNVIAQLGLVQPARCGWCSAASCPATWIRSSSPAAPGR